MWKYTLDLTAGYLHSHDDWLAAIGVAPGNFSGNDYFVGLDYYIKRGFAISGRFDRLNQQILGNGSVGLQNTHDWTIGANKALTLSGNIVGRIAYSNLSGRDPVAAVKS